MACMAPRSGGPCAPDLPFRPVRSRHPRHAARASCGAVARRERARRAAVFAPSVRAGARRAAATNPGGRIKPRAVARDGVRRRARGPGAVRNRQLDQGWRRPGRAGDESGPWPRRVRRVGRARSIPMLIEAPTDTLLPVYATFPLRAVAGHGSWLVDDEGNEWLDAYGGHAVASSGHSHPDVVAAIAEQAAKLIFYSTAVPHAGREHLGDTLVRLSPEPLGKVFFCNSGAEANENQLNLARRRTGRG